jgi:hypothetical protein
MQRSQTIREVKEILGTKSGLSRGSQLFVLDDKRTDIDDLSLKFHETVGQVMEYTESDTELLLAVMAGNSTSAIDLCGFISPDALVTIGTGRPGSGDDAFKNPQGGMAFVPAHPDFLIVSDYDNHRVKIHHTQTGALIYQLGGEQSLAEGGFSGPYDIAVSADSEQVLVCERGNCRVQVMRLIVDGGTPTLEFVRFLGRLGSRPGPYLMNPTGVALRLNEDGAETVLVAGSLSTYLPRSIHFLTHTIRCARSEPNHQTKTTTACKNLAWMGNTIASLQATVKRAKGRVSGLRV